METIKLFYGRTSTKEQDLTRQIEWANSHGISNEHDIFLDKQTGKSFNRPKYKELKTEIKKLHSRGQQIELYVMEIDRLGRNKELTLKEISELKSQGVILRLGNIPQTMTEGDDIFTQMVQNIMIEIYTTMAQQEIELKRERQRTAYESLEKDSKGRKISRKKNVVIGRPNKIESLTPKQDKSIKQWLSKDIKLADCMELTKLSRATLYRIKKSIEQEK